MGLGKGLVGAGLSITIGVISKDTQAWIGKGAIVNAKGGATGTVDVLQDVTGFQFDAATAVDPMANTITLGPTGLQAGDAVMYSNGGNVSVGGLANDGTYYVRPAADPTKVTLHRTREGAIDGTDMVLLGSGSGTTHQLIPKRVATLPTVGIHGLAVQARSTETVFGLASGGTGQSLLGLAGSVTVAIVDSDTAAFIDENAQINSDQEAPTRPRRWTSRRRATRACTGCR